MNKKILIVDDHLVVRLGLELLLSDFFENLEFYAAETFEECLKKIEKLDFDLIFLDINLPDGEKTEMVKKIKIINRNLKILVFSAHEEVNLAARYIKAGAEGFVSKLSDDTVVLSAVKEILAGNVFYSDEIKKAIKYVETIDLDLEMSKLSKREFEVAKLLVKGYGNLEISNKLEIKMSTVSTYKLRIFEKLHITNTIELLSVFNEY